MKAAWLIAVAYFGSSTAFTQDATPAKSIVTVDADGTVRIPAFALPLSRGMSEEAKRAYLKQRLDSPSMAGIDTIADYRAALDRVFYGPLLASAEASYPVTIESQNIGGVRTDVVRPKGGVARGNRDRVLITLHGGGFAVGAGMGGLIQAIPIASVAKITVISVDYRQGPEYQFPAASEDVGAVYRELLKRYKARNIGIYGSSSGSVLTAMSVAFFQNHNLPNPGAIALLCESAMGGLGGDSSFIAVPLNPRLGGREAPPPPNVKPSQDPTDYLGKVDLKDPRVAPALYPQILAKFPPTLAITGTRDEAMSDVVSTHAKLVNAGIEAELHVWEGMWHSFFFDTSLPESREMFAVVARFFDRQLGRTGPAMQP